MSKSKTKPLTLEQQVTSREISHEMDKLGLPKGKVWWWVEDVGGNILLCYINKAGMFYSIKIGKEPLPVFDYSARTCAEMGDILPGKIQAPAILTTEACFLQIRKWVDCKGTTMYGVQYEGESSYYIAPYKTADTLANAMGKMAIWLRKEKLL